MDSARLSYAPDRPRMHNAPLFCKEQTTRHWAGFSFCVQPREACTKLIWEGPFRVQEGIQPLFFSLSISLFRRRFLAQPVPA